MQISTWRPHESGGNLLLMKYPRLIAAIFAALAIAALVNARAALAQDATPDSAASADVSAPSTEASAPSADVSIPSTDASIPDDDVSGGADSSWERAGAATDPTIDDDAETADKVLEIPQAVCSKDGAGPSCSTDADRDDDDDDDSQVINAPSPGAPPPTLDDDTTSSAAPPDDWGDVDDYQNQQVYAAPYAVPYAVPYPYQVTSAAPTNQLSPPSTFVPMSSPLTPAARPPLNPGPWMLSPHTYSHPAGSPMIGMAMGFHH